VVIEVGAALLETGAILGRWVGKRQALSRNLR
jgi:hypothetical protein